MFPRSKAVDGSALLRRLSASISDDELDRFACEAGFSEPNCFPFQRMRQILATHEFPTTDHVEYGWAVSECGIERISSYSLSLRLFATVLYLYCHRTTAFNGNQDGTFFYSLLNDSALWQEGESFGRQLLHLCEWLVEFVPSHQDHDAYYLLLAWLFVKLYLSETMDEAFSDVMAWFQVRRYSAEDIRLGNDNVFPEATDWLGLLDRWSMPDGFDDGALLPVIMGYDV